MKKIKNSFLILLSLIIVLLNAQENNKKSLIAYNLLPIDNNETKNNLNESEDELIIKALYYDINNPKLAAATWKKLFLKTNNDQYLIEYFNDALSFKNIKDVIEELKSILKNKKNQELHELLANLYIKEGNNNNAINILENIQNLDIDSLYQLAYLYMLNNKDKKALAIYDKIYQDNKTWDALKGKLAIYSKNHNISKIKEILWNEIQTNNTLPVEAFITYLGLIDLKQDTNKALVIIKKLYEKTKDKKYLKDLISLYIYKKDYKNLIPLLKKTGYDNKLLYELQISSGNLEDAVNTVDILYKNTKDPVYIAEKAILMYELAIKYNALNKNVIKSVSKEFEKAFSLGLKNDMYYNYYGYILINNDIDIKKGLFFVKAATKNNENNIYYLDSLAWGYSKLNNCKEALDIIAKIRKIDPKLNQKDILKHINIIENKCKKE